MLDSLTILGIAIVVVIVAAVLGWYLYSVKWALIKKPVTGPESLIGKPGVVVAPIDRDRMGEVNVDGIIWKAKIPENVESHRSSLSVGDSVIIVGYADLTVVVEKR